MVTPPAVIFVVVVPVASRPVAMVPSIVPLPFIVMTFFPLSTLPVTVSVIVPVAIPTRTNDNSGRRFHIHRWRRSVDRLGRKHSTGDANVYSNIDVREGDRRYAYAEACNQRHRQPATA
jgi:hypothetical protein